MSAPHSFLLDAQSAALSRGATPPFSRRKTRACCAKPVAQEKLRFQDLPFGMASQNRQTWFVGTAWDPPCSNIK
ncbi:hypothetical protein M0657_005990 [Pyricularia oryzae]|nr:hypothetical protein M0657_005990 [Pyricularia oryzae]KAI7926176.1 hypothetical protein M9X92_002921 [Pyricularia oryzae]